MKKQLAKFALTAILGLALTLTLSCSSSDSSGDVSSSSGDNGGGGGSSSSVTGNGGGSSSSVGGSDASSSSVASGSGSSSSATGGGSSSSVGGGDPNNGGASSPSGGGNSSGGSCNISSYRNKEMPDGKTWMTENLNCNVAGSECYDKNESNCNTYGRLYTWEAAKKACSGGWHLPDTTEWNALVTSVGGSSTAGKHLKAKEGWNRCGPTGSGERYSCEDTYGFSALPGGFGYSGGYFGDVGNGGNWWSASEDNSDYANYRGMDYYGERVYYDFNGKEYLFSVRCVQDSP